MCTYIPTFFFDELKIIISLSVAAHAAVALADFCDGFGHEQHLPYLDPIVNKLFEILHPSNSLANPVRHYVQEQAITTLGAVAKAGGTNFNKVSSLSNLLLTRRN